MVKVCILKYGCTANYDTSNIIGGLLKQAGFEISDEKDAEVVVVGSCIVKGVTAEKINYKIKQLIKQNKKTVISGCMAEAEYKRLKKEFPEASIVNTFYTTEIVGVVNDLLQGKNNYLIGKRKEIKLGLPKLSDDKAATVQIAEGCKSCCAFCETKIAKGDLKSFPEDLIVKEVKRFVDEDYKRINLTSTDNGCYGFDIGTDLPNLLEKVIKVKGDFIIRVGMMNPFHVLRYLDRLVNVYKSSKIMKFLHSPIQSGSDKVLKEMRREYTVEEFFKIVDMFREDVPGINISTDLIIGYPTETEKDFEQTLNFLRKLKPEVLNISKFASRPRTKAFKLRQLDSRIIKRRSVIISNEYKKIPNDFKLNTICYEEAIKSEV